MTSLIDCYFNNFNTYNKINLLLENGCNPNETIINTNTSFLMILCKDNNINLIKLLLKYNVKINNQNNSKMTALMYASCFGNVECVKILLENGANIYFKNCYGYTSLFYAIFYKYNKIVDLLKLYHFINRAKYYKSIIIIQRNYREYIAKPTSNYVKKLCDMDCDKI